MLFATNPLLSAVDDLVAGLHSSCVKVASELSQSTDGTTTVQILASLDAPPSERGQLSIACSYVSSALHDLSTQRECHSDTAWLPDEVALRLRVSWRPCRNVADYDVDPDVLLALAQRISVYGDDPLHRVQQTAISTPGLTVDGVEVAVDFEDRLTLAQTHACDFGRYAGELVAFAAGCAAELAG